MHVEEENKSEGLDFNMSFLNELDEETTQESETESLHDEDVTVLDEEGSVEKLDEVEEESELEEELEEDESELEDEEVISYSPFLDPLVDEGILVRLEDKEYDFNSPEVTRELIEDTLSVRDSERLSQLPEVLQRVFELSKLGEDPMSAFENLTPFDYSQIDLEDVDTQKNLTKDYLAEKFPKWTDEKLNKELQNREDLDELKELAEEAQAYFIEQTESQKQEYLESVRLAKEENDRLAIEEINAYKELIDNSEGFNGIKFTSNKQRDEFKAYTLARGEDGLTQYERETKAKEDQLALAWVKFNKQATMESIQRKATTDATLKQLKNLKRLGQQDKNAKSGKSYSDKQAKPNGGLFIPDVTQLI